MMLGGSRTRGDGQRTCRYGHPVILHHHCNEPGCGSSLDQCPNKQNHLNAQEGKR